MAGILGNKASDETFRPPEELQENRGLRNLGAALIESGFSQMGQQGAGRAIAQYLRDEWHREELKTFQATVGAQTQQKVGALMDSYKRRTKVVTEVPTEQSDPEAQLRTGYYADFDPETGTPIPTSFIPATDFMAVNNHLNSSASDLIGGLQGISMEFLDAAAEYPNNPLIEARARMMMDHISGSFSGQLESYKMAEQNMQNQRAAADASKATDEATLFTKTLPDQIRAAEADADITVFQAQDWRTKMAAEERSGEERLALLGLDPSAYDTDEKIAAYRQYRMNVLDAAQDYKAKGSMLPPGVDLTTLPDWLRYDAKGNGFLMNFMLKESEKALQHPDVKAELDKVAMEMAKKPYSELPKQGDGKGMVIGQDDVKREVLNSPEVYEHVEGKAIRRATQYLLDTKQIGGQLGVRRMPIPGTLGETAMTFENADEAMRLTHPELYAAENVAKYPEAERLYNEEAGEAGFSGDPEDPFGPGVLEAESTEDPSPIAPTTIASDEKSIMGFIDWFEEFADDPTVPKETKRKQAQKAIRELGAIMRRTADRFSIEGEYGLPAAGGNEEYQKLITELLALRSDYARLFTKGDFTEERRTLGSDMGKVFGVIGEFINMQHQDNKETLEAFGEGTANVVEYLGLPEKWRDEYKKFGKGALMITSPGAAIAGMPESGQPYWMVSDEEKQRRQEAYQAYMASKGFPKQ